MIVDKGKDFTKSALNTPICTSTKKSEKVSGKVAKVRISSDEEEDMLPICKDSSRLVNLFLPFSSNCYTPFFILFSFYLLAGLKTFC